MTRSFSVLAAGAVLAVGGGAANAGVIDFTLADNAQNGVVLPNTYQPVAGVTVGYSNVSTYNGAADHTSGTAGTDNYFVYPSSGNQGVMTYTFSVPVSIPSLYVDTFHDTGVVVISAYDSTNTLITSYNVTPPAHGDAAPTFVQSTGLAAFNNIETLTITNAGSNDAANADDISVTVPEPASLGVGAIGMLGLLARRRKASR